MYRWFLCSFNKTGSQETQSFWMTVQFAVALNGGQSLVNNPDNILFSDNVTVKTLDWHPPKPDYIVTRTTIRACEGKPQHIERHLTSHSAFSFKQWDLVCEYSSLGWATNSIMFTGWLFGNVIFGILSDKYGRRKILFFSSCMVCWVAFASSFAPYYWLYAIFRFFIGFGLGKSVIDHVNRVITW